MHWCWNSASKAGFWEEAVAENETQYLTRMIDAARKGNKTE